MPHPMLLPAHLAPTLPDPLRDAHPALRRIDLPAGSGLQAEIAARLLESDALLPPAEAPPRPGILSRLRAWAPRFGLWLRAMPLP